VAGDDGVVGETGRSPPVSQVDVGTADPGPLDPHEHLIRARLRNFALPDPHAPRLLEDNRAIHRVSPAKRCDDSATARTRLC